MSASSQSAASFRDPSGFVFQRDGRLFRQVNHAYREHYDHLIDSGLYAALVADGSLIDHREVDDDPHQPALAYKVLSPTRVPFISYPYEWCFGQLRAAALLTLAVQKRALGSGMSLKDASAYNVQFLGSRPVFIDTLSFEKYAEGEPWVAYRQFCQHFLAPLALMSRTDVRLGQLSRVHLDGVPLDLAARLLPFASRFRPALLLHLHLHARAQKRYADAPAKPVRGAVSLHALRALIDHLESAVRGLSWRPAGTEWADYVETHGYAPEALDHKKQIVKEFLAETDPKTVWDLGANTGVFSRIASERGAYTVAFDLDPACVEKNYQEGVRRGETNLLPLLLDVTNPSTGAGWGNRERMALAERGPADAVLALALVHHLAVGHNLPLAAVAEFLATVARSLVIEFVPKEDPQVARLLVSRKDIFTDYHQQEFERAFGRYFALQQSRPVGQSGRTLYLMSRRRPG